MFGLQRSEMQATDEGGKYEMMCTKPGGPIKMNANNKSHILDSTWMAVRYRPEHRDCVGIEPLWWVTFRISRMST